MTNLERIRKMNSHEIAMMLKSFMATDTHEYADVEAWLNSEDVDMIYKGVPAKAKILDEITECTLVGSTGISGDRYGILIIDGTLCHVPWKDIDYGRDKSI